MIDFLESINEKVGKLFSWFTLILVVAMCIDVAMRYLFKTSFIWLNELETYFFAIIILFAGGYAFKHDAHVRVDLFYGKMTEKEKAKVNLIGGLLFLIPWTIIAIKVCFRYAVASYRIGENSVQAGGLSAVYVLKFIVAIGFVLLLTQALASVLRAVRTLKG